MDIVNILYRGRDPSNVIDWLVHRAEEQSGEQSIRPQPHYATCQAGTRFVSNACHCEAFFVLQCLNQANFTSSGHRGRTDWSTVVSHTPDTESPENMVSLQTVRAHNSNLKDIGTGLVAVFGAFNPS